MFTYKANQLPFTEQRRQRQRHKVAQTASLFESTKLPWDQGKEKHREQKRLVSLLSFKSPVSTLLARTDAEGGFSAGHRATLLGKIPALFLCSYQRTAGPPHRPRASATTVSLRLASEGCGCRRGRSSVTSPTPAANQHQLPVCAFLAQRSAMGSAAEGYTGVTELYNQPGIIYVL